MKKLLIIVFVLSLLPVRAVALTDAELNSVFASLTLDQKLGQLFMPGVEGLQMNDDLRALLTENHLGGVILFGGRNVMNRTQSAAFTGDLQTVSRAANNGVPLLISIDQEGGVGSHVNMLTGGVDTVGNMALGASPDVEDTYASYAIMADDLRAYGINMALAPVLDVLLNKDNTMNHIRSFGADPAAVAARGVRAVAGFQDNGVIACVKHYPGKGDTPVDSHKAAPLTDEDRDTLERTILAPFRAAIGAGADSVMINHEIYTALDPGVVATVSPAIITGLLKDDMKFHGLVITDSITMGGVTKTINKVDAAYLSIKAGADMILFAGTGADSYVDSIAMLKEKIQTGELDMARVDDAVMRVLRIKNKYGLFDSAPAEHPDAYMQRKKDNLKKARGIARRTITIVKNNGALPLDAARADRILVVAPGAFFTVPLMESTFPVGTDLATKMKHYAPGVRAVIYDLKTIDRDTQKALAAAADADVIVVGSILAYFSPEISRMVRRLKSETGKPVVVVGLSVPYDLERFPEVDAFVAAYNPRSVSLEAAVEVLFGKIQPAGVLPVSVDIKD